MSLEAASPYTTPTTPWPSDREAVRFVVLSGPDRRGLQRIKSLAWIDGRAALIEKTTSLDSLIASARRRSVVFDIVDLQREAA